MYVIISCITIFLSHYTHHTQIPSKFKPMIIITCSKYGHNGDVLGGNHWFRIDNADHTCMPHATALAMGNNSHKEPTVVFITFALHICSQLYVHRFRPQGSIGMIDHNNYIIVTST